jgi:cobalt-zinc-cadmium efflux system membrane fusion protein
LNKLLLYLVIPLALGLVSCQGGGDGHGEAATETAAPGPHGGRLLSDGDFQVEVTIFERGVPPQFRVYFYDKGEAIDPAGVDLSIELHRIAGRVDTFRFAKESDYLVGDKVVDEPHSFDVAVTAVYTGAKHSWKYASYEGRTTITDEAAQGSEITIAIVGPAAIRDVIRVFGRIGPNEDHLREVAPRFPGVVKEVRKRQGEQVAKDEVMAVIESNESLQLYEVKSAMAGTVIRKEVTPGKFVREGEPIYTVADLSEVWVDLNVHRRDFEKLKIGQAVTVTSGEGTTGAVGVVSYISPFGSEDTQTMLARVELPNPNGRWRPGLFVVGEIIVDETTVPLAVKADALQTFRDWDVVFIRDGNLFEIAILELGRRDDEWVEVISGLTAGQLYAAENSFIVKADIGKSGATHDH